MCNCCLQDSKSLWNVLSSESEILSGCFLPFKSLHSWPCNCDSSRIVLLFIEHLTVSSDGHSTQRKLYDVISDLKNIIQHQEPVQDKSNFSEGLTCIFLFAKQKSNLLCNLLKLRASITIRKNLMS